MGDGTDGCRGFFVESHNEAFKNWIPQSELELMTSAVRLFNDTHGYLDEIIVHSYKNHQVLMISPAESAMFVESYLNFFSEFSRKKIRQDLIKELEDCW